MPLPKESFALSEAQRSFLGLCLGIAAEKFQANGEFLVLEAQRLHPNGRALVEVADEFRRQVLEATELQTRLMQSDVITVGAVEPDDEEEEDIEDTETATDVNEPVCDACGTGLTDGLYTCGCNDQPDEDAITTKDHVKFYQYGKLVFTYNAEGNVINIVANGQHARKFIQDETIRNAEAAIRRYCDETQFWPDAWFISDHGNAHRIDLAVKA